MPGETIGMPDVPHFERKEVLSAATSEVDRQDLPRCLKSLLRAGEGERIDTLEVESSGVLLALRDCIFSADDTFLVGCEVGGCTREEAVTIDEETCSFVVIGDSTEATGECRVELLSPRLGEVAVANPKRK